MARALLALLTGLSIATPCNTLWNSEPDAFVDVYVYWEFPAEKLDDFKAGILEFSALTKQEPGNRFYGFTMQETSAVCKESYVSGQAFLDHLANVKAPLDVALGFASITKIEVHGPASEFEVLKNPLDSFPVTYWPLVPSSFYVPANVKTAADLSLTVFVYWNFTEGNASAFEAGISDFTALTKQEAKNVFYGFTIRATSAVCREAYVDAHGFLDHLANVDTPLQAALKISSILKIEAHGPAVELEKLKEPLAAFPVTYWVLEPGAFYMPCQYPLVNSQPSPPDTSVNVMVHWSFPAEKYDSYKNGTHEFTALTKHEPGNVYYGFTMRATTAVCKEGYVDAQAFLDHLANVDAPLQIALTFSSITAIEVHGPAEELEKLKTPLAAFLPSYWATHSSSYYVAAKYNPVADTTVAMMVYWEFTAESHDAFVDGMPAFVKLTKKEAANVYYGFTVLDKTTAVCKEGYTSAQGFLDHLRNVNAPLNEALKVAKILRIEAHGPAAELEKLKAPLASFSVSYWALDPGAFVKHVGCEKPIFYSHGERQTTCGDMKQAYKEYDCCGAPNKVATRFKMSCGAARSHYKREGCCGMPDKETMVQH